MAILPKYNIIINIEVKRGAAFSKLTIASKQTQMHYSLFKKIFGSSLRKQWNFVKAACVPNLKSEEGICNHCKFFLLNEKTLNNMSSWIVNLLRRVPKIEVDNSSQDYEDLLVAILGYQSIRNITEGNLDAKIIDPEKLRLGTEKKITSGNPGITGENDADSQQLKRSWEGDITGKEQANSKKLKRARNDLQTQYLCYMLNPEQLQAFKCTSKCLIIIGDFGTGKTYVLKERTKNCASTNLNDRVAYINLTALNVYTDTIKLQSNLSVMDLIAENDFESTSNIKVITCRELSGHLSAHLDEISHTENNEALLIDVINSFLAKNSHFKHVFIDELPSIRNEVKELLPEKKYKTLCVTMKVDTLASNRNQEWFKMMKSRHSADQVTLSNNMRNSVNVENASTAFGMYSGSYLTPSKNINGVNNYYYRNIHKLDEISLSVAAIKKHFLRNLAKSKESVVVIMQKLHDQREYNVLQKQFSNVTKVSCINIMQNDNEAKNFFINPKGIFLTDMDSFHGAQARNVILFLDDSAESDSNQSNRNMILRCMVFGIVIITSRMETRTVLGLTEDDNLHTHIQEIQPKCFYNGNNTLVNRLEDAIKYSLKLDEFPVVIILGILNGEKFYEGLQQRFGDFDNPMDIPSFSSRKYKSFFCNKFDKDECDVIESILSGKQSMEGKIMLFLDLSKEKYHIDTSLAR